MVNTVINYQRRKNKYPIFIDELRTAIPSIIGWPLHLTDILVAQMIDSLRDWLSYCLTERLSE